MRRARRQSREPRTRQAMANTITAGELASVRAIFGFQRVLASGSGDPASLIAQVDAVSAAYPQLANDQVRGWADQIYAGLASLPVTCSVGTVSFPDLYVASKYAAACQTVGYRGYGCNY